MKKESGLFVHEIGCFNDQIIVAYNIPLDKILKLIEGKIKQGKFLKAVKPFIQNMLKNYVPREPPDKGFVYQEGARQILVINEWDGSWDKHETLLHECVHLMQDIKERKGFEDRETEAYLVEHLFRSIRRRLPTR